MTISKQGGRRYPQARSIQPNWFEQAVWLSSIGRFIPGTLLRTVLVGFRTRTVVVNQR